MSVRITASLIKEVLPAADYNKLTKSDIVAIEMALVKHILHLTNYKEYGLELKTILSTTLRKNLRSCALTNFEVIVRLKFALLAVLRAKTIDRAETKAIFKQHGISNHSVLIRKLAETKLYAKAVTAAKTIKWDLRSEKDVVTACNDMIDKITSYMNKFAYRKLRFLSNSNNLELRDIIADLREKAVQAFYAITPFITPEHTINSIKRAIHNKGINLIKFYDANKRKRLNNNQDGTFSNTLVSMTLTSRDGEDAGENPAMYRNVIDTRYRDLETRISIQSLLQTHGVHPLKNKVLKLLSMDADPEFTQFIAKQHKMVKGDFSTDEIFPVIGRDNFLESVRQYVGVNKDSFRTFIHELQRVM